MPDAPSSLRVLVVDDEPSLVEELRDFLSWQDIVVSTAANAIQALDVLASLPAITVVLTDIRMPGIDGLALTNRILRARGGADAIEVVLMTGHGNVASAAEAVRAGAFDFLRKPMVLDELLAVIRRAHVKAQARRAAEMALHDSEALFRQAAEAARFCVFHHDLGQPTSQWSNMVWKIHGLPHRDAPPADAELHALTHPADIESRTAQFAALRHSAAVDRGDIHYRIIRPDGAVRHLQVTVTYRRDADGRPVGAEGVLMDVTERRVVEDALAASETRFRHAVAATGQGVFERDLVGNVSVWSPRQWEIYGLEPQAAPPSATDILAMIHPDDRAKIMEQRDVALLNPSHDRLVLEFRITRPDGMMRQLVTSSLCTFSAPAADGSTRAVKVYGVTSDITEERALRAQALISDNLATLGQMATGIAHEFGQPLQAIATQAATAQVYLETADSLPMVEKVRGTLVKIEQQADRLGNTMRHLLAFGRGEPGDATSATTASAAVAGALDLVGKLLRTAGIIVKIDLPDSLPPVLCEKLQLERVLLNLFLNARDAMENRAEQRLTVTGRSVAASNGTTAGFVEIDVEDTGGGIPDSVLSRVFDPFFTTKEVGKGTGLGLALCRSALEASGGTIVATNTGRGARFTIRLPPAG